MNKDTDMTMQERLRSEGDVWHKQIADHIDQLEADKAELVDALRMICLAIDAIDGHEKPADWGNLGAAQGDAENLIAKHKAKP